MRNSEVSHSGAGGHMRDDERVVREILIPALREDAWRAVTEPDGVAAWLGGDAVLEPRPRGTVRCRRADGTELEGVVVSVTAPIRLVLLWAEARRDADAEQRDPSGPRLAPELAEASRVEIVLLEDPEGTRITVTESRVGAEGGWLLFGTGPTSALAGTGS